MTNKALAACQRYELLCDGDSVLVALSGGADSAALLHFLISIKESFHLTICAAHLHHGIRGEEADRDEQFCKILCENYNIQLFTAHRDIPALAALRHQSEELCGREERYAFLEALAGEHHAKIATAHTASDNAETLLMRMTRGSSLRGMAGIPAKRGNIIRPLITCSRAEIEAYCALHQLAFVSDSTNFTDAYTRNRLRHQVIPVLRELNPRLEEAFTRLSEAAGEAAAYLDRQSESLLSAAKTACGYDVKTLLQADHAVLKNALIILLRNYHIAPEQKQLDLLLSVLQTGGAVELSKSLTLACGQGQLYAILPSEPVSVPFTGAIQFSFREKNITATANNSIKENNSLLFRTRQDGDTFYFPKRNIKKPLGKALRDAGYPAGSRDSVLCLCEGSVVLWCEPLGYSAQGERYKAKYQLKIIIN